jgi:hypothetical protein
MASRFVISLILFGLLLPLSISVDPCRFELNTSVIDLSSVGQTNGTAKYDNRKTSRQPGYSMFTINLILISIKGIFDRL